MNYALFSVNCTYIFHCISLHVRILIDLFYLSLFLSISKLFSHLYIYFCIEVFSDICCTQLVETLFHLYYTFFSLWLPFNLCVTNVKLYNVYRNRICKYLYVLYIYLLWHDFVFSLFNLINHFKMHLQLKTLLLAPYIFCLCYFFFMFCFRYLLNRFVCINFSAVESILNPIFCFHLFFMCIRNFG